MQDPVSLLRPGRRPLEVPIIVIIIVMMLIMIIVVINMITKITFKVTSTGGLLRWPSCDNHDDHGGPHDHRHDDCHGGHDGHGENQMYLLTLSIFR